MSTTNNIPPAARITDLPSLRFNVDALKADLARVFANYGLTFISEKARIGGGECHFTIVTKTGSVEDQEERDRANFAQWASLFNIPADAFGKTITLQGEAFKIVGIDPAKPKNCMSIRRVKDDRGFKCPPDTVRFALARAA